MSAGFLDIVDQLLSAGADVNKLTHDKWTALHEAATNGHVAVSERLLSAGTDVSPAVFLTIPATCARPLSLSCDTTVKHSMSNCSSQQ
jgi:ankyrin repeat protein